MYLVLSTVIAFAMVLPAISAQSSGPKNLLGESHPSQPIAPCQSLTRDASDQVAVFSSFVPESAYVDLPIEQIEKRVPLLNPTKFEGIYPEGDAGTATQLTNKAQDILSKAGVAITDLLHRTPDLTAKEDVRLTGWNLSSTHLYIGGKVVTPKSKWSHTSDYDYRIVKQKVSGGDTLVEFRTDARGQLIDNSASNPNRPLDIGFATIWLTFLPGNLSYSRFRYLGEQSIGKRKTYVLAFAQKPEVVGQQPSIDYGSGQCLAPLQGVAWIDQSTFQLVRIQTDLLYPLPGIELDQLRSLLTYAPVKISGLDLSLWLPNDVETTWRMTFRTARESHRYSDYRLFKATMKVLPGFEIPTR